MNQAGTQAQRAGCWMLAAVVTLAATVSACAPTLTPAQEHGYKAVEDCRAKGGQQDWTYAVLPNGSLRFEGRADGFEGVKRCLQDKWGYRF